MPRKVTTTAFCALFALLLLSSAIIIANPVEAETYGDFEYEVYGSEVWITQGPTVETW